MWLHKWTVDMTIKGVIDDCIYQQTPPNVSRYIWPPPESSAPYFSFQGQSSSEWSEQSVDVPANLLHNLPWSPLNKQSEAFKPGRESFNLNLWCTLQVQCTCLCYISSMLGAFYLNCITFAVCYMTDHHVVWSASKLCRLCDQCLSDHFLTCQHHCWLATNEHPIDWPIALSKLHKRLTLDSHEIWLAFITCFQ